MDADGQTVRDKLEVIYKGGKVVQIEATSPTFRTAGGLSTASPLSVLNRAINPKRYTTYDYGDSTGGYLQYYLDQVQSGIAFESGAHQDNWFWDRGSETLIVHLKGVPVLPDQGGKFYSSTAYVPAEDQ